MGGRRCRGRARLLTSPNLSEVSRISGQSEVMVRSNRAAKPEGCGFTLCLKNDPARTTVAPAAAIRCGFQTHATGAVFGDGTARCVYAVALAAKEIRHLPKASLLR